MNVYKLLPFLDNASCGLCCVFLKNAYAFNEISLLKMCFQLKATLKDLIYVDTVVLYMQRFLLLTYLQTIPLKGNEIFGLISLEDHVFGIDHQGIIHIYR